MMMQTLAILHDAYRELNAKKLFWIVLALSGVVVLAFAALGLNEEGIELLWWTIPVAIFNTDVMSEETFYKLTFHNLGIGLWLTWIATILALVSTASIIPDFISSGSIDLMLSKPIGRLRLFFTKYIAGLLFVTLQVAVFTICSFLVIGIRGGAWESSLFLAIPIVVLFFSYLFSVCVLLGMLTRSTIAALLLTILAWFLIFAVGSTENIFLQLRIEREMRVVAGAQQVEVRRQRVVDIERDLLELQEVEPPAASDAEREEALAEERQQLEERLERMRVQLSTKETQLEKAHKSEATWSRVHWYSYLGKTLLPKTSETVELLDRVLIATEDMEGFIRSQREQSPAFTTGDDEIAVNPIDVGWELQKRIRARSLTWVVGTSLGFEAVMLGLAGWIFCRRDF
ncbi:MAG: ABC transporter permease [Phycisphaerales bacterium JB038]